VGWHFATQNIFKKSSQLVTGMDFKNKDNDFLGNLMHIHINVKYIEKCLDESINDDGEVVLFDFLNKLLKGVQDALGNVNKFSVAFEPERNTIVIREDNNLRYGGKGRTSEKMTRFEIFGLNQTEGGSFCTSVDFNVQIPSNFATMVSVGAQSNGNQVGTNGTAFSELNAGITDRTIKEKSDFSTVVSNKKETISTSEYNKLNESKKKELAKEMGFSKDKDGGIARYKKLAAKNPISVKEKLDSNIKKMKESLELIWPSKNITGVDDKGITVKDVDIQGLILDPDNISQLKSINRDVSKYITGNLAIEGYIPGPFFLPFDLNLKMWGLSGMRIYEKFSINQNMLPKIYHNDDKERTSKIEFLIKGVTHDITGNQWSTSLNTISVPVEPKNVSKILPVPPNPPPSPTQNKIKNTPQEKGTKGKTITTGYPLNPIFWKKEFPKNTIYLHHTAGRHNIKGIINGWNKRTDHVCTHVIIDNVGATEYLFEDKWYGNHLGIPSRTFKNNNLSWKNLNQTSLGIELTNFGYLRLVGGKYKTYVNSTMDPTLVAQPIDKYGNVKAYKGYLYFEKYTKSQIDACKKVIQDWQAKYSIPFKYNYDELFPPGNSLSKNALKGIPGLFTHNSVRSDKTDIFPQKELIDMLKSISS